MGDMAKQINLDDAIEKLQECMRHYGRSPSYEEISKWFGYKSKNAAYWLVARLKEKKLIQSDAQGKLIFEGLNFLKLLGSVQAGFPSPAEEELVDVMDLNAFLVRHPSNTYLIRVQGDSMDGAGIKAGDLVIVERGRDPQQNDIVIAEVDGEWTMKYYMKKGKSIVLIAANDKYEPIYPQYELKVGGVVTGVVRKYK